MITPTCRRNCLSACKKSNSCRPSFLRYCRLAVWVLWACLAMATKNNFICFKRTLMVTFMQKVKLISHLFLAKILQFVIWVLYACLAIHAKTTVSPCREYCCVFTCKKSTWTLTSFLRYYTLKSPAIWLAKSIFTH